LLRGFHPHLPQAAEQLIKERTALLIFHDFQAEQWVSIRTINQRKRISFATIMHRATHTQRCVSRHTCWAWIPMTLTASPAAG
jgi:hypothetical protein